MKEHIRKSALLLILPFLTAGFAAADTITITETTTVTGSLGGTQFLTGTSLTIVFTGNTADIYEYVPGLYRLPQSVDTTVTIAGLGTFDIADPTHAFTQNSTFALGPIGAGITDENTGLQIYDNDSAFDPFLLDSNIGPITDNDDNLTGEAANLTNEENLNIFSNGPITYTAVIATTSATPEPSSLAFLGTGFMGLLAVTKRRLR